MSTVSGGVTFSQFAEAREETVNPGAELNVLKAVLLREGYLRRLVELGKESTRTLSPGLGDLLDIVRISSVEVVEAISEWRKVSSLHKKNKKKTRGLHHSTWQSHFLQ